MFSLLYLWVLWNFTLNESYFRWLSSATWLICSIDVLNSFLQILNLYSLCFVLLCLFKVQFLADLYSQSSHLHYFEIFSSFLDSSVSFAAFRASAQNLNSVTLWSLDWDFFSLTSFEISFSTMTYFWSSILM